MNKRIVFRGVESSANMEKYIEEAFRKIDAFFEEHNRTPLTCDVILESHPTHATSKCEIRITSPEYRLVVHEEGQDMYKLVHDVVDKAYTRLLKEKKIWDDKHKGR